MQRAGRWRVLRSSVVLALALWLAPSPLAASDFWDEVRSPGLSAHRALIAAARELLQANRAELALLRADAAIEKRPERPAGHVVRGRALAALGRSEAALPAFEAALARSGAALDDEHDALVAARTALRCGRFELARAVASRTLARTRSAATRSAALFLLGDALQASGPEALRRALAVYREALVEDALDKSALLGLALALHRSGDREQALLLAARAKSEPDGSALPPAELAARRGLWLLAIGDETAAAEAFGQAAAQPGPWQEHARKAAAAQGATR